MSRPTGTVVGRFLLSDGSPALGRVHFTPAPERVLVQKDGESSINLPPRVTALLDEEGKFEKVLLATEGPGVDPTGWTYRVDVEVPGVWETPYYFDLPAGTTVDLADYVPVPESGGTSVEKGVLQVVAGDNVTVDSSNPQRPIVGVQLEELEWNNLNGVPDTFPPAAHSHTIGEVVGLQDELDGKQVAGDYLTEGDLPAPPDLSPYAKTADLASVATSGSYDDLTDKPDIPSTPGDVGARPAGDVPWGEVSGKPSTFPPATHTHSIGDVTGLQTALDDLDDAIGDVGSVLDTILGGTP